MTRLLALLALLLSPVVGLAQDEGTMNLDMYTWELSAQCPCAMDDDWTVNSVVAFSDTVTLEIEAPAMLNGFLSMLTGDNDNVKRLWTKHVMQFGDSWKLLVDLVASERRWLRLILTPSGSGQSEIVLINPEALARFL